MNDLPLVSIVTVSYNQAEFLEEALLSVLKQDYKNIEYIVFDGGSTDGSVDILRKYEKDISFLNIGPDGGASAALNAGFEKSKGQILAYINSDDVLLPGTVSRWVEYFKDPTISVVFGDISIIDEAGRPSTLPGKSVSTFLAGPFSTLMYAVGASVIPQQAAAWKREVFFNVGGFEPANKTCWDKEFFADAAILGYKFQRIPMVLAKFRVHSASISGTGRNQTVRVIDHSRIKRKFDKAKIRGNFLTAKFLNLYCKVFRAARYASRSIGL